VLLPEKSAHVLGLAIDVQPYAAYTWLEGTKAAWSFCRIYDNEAWHFEYNPDFVTAGCPARLPHPVP
jgi:D-alanyl-D-alanine carboxypeptidase